jgi:hypothetical protein
MLAARVRPVRPKRIILLGFFLVLGGAILPFLMVLRVLEPTFFLSFLSYGASVAGLALGLVGISMLSDRRDR